MAFGRSRSILVRRSTAKRGTTVRAFRPTEDISFSQANVDFRPRSTINPSRTRNLLAECTARSTVSATSIACCSLKHWVPPTGSAANPLPQSRTSAQAGGPLGGRETRTPGFVLRLQDGFSCPLHLGGETG